MKTIGELIDWHAMAMNVKGVQAFLDSYKFKNLDFWIDPNEEEDAQMFLIAVTIKERLADISVSIRTADSIEIEMLESKRKVREIAQNEQIRNGYYAVFEYETELALNCSYSILSSTINIYLRNASLYYNSLYNVRDFAIKFEYYEILKHFLQIKSDDHFIDVINGVKKSEEN